MLPTEPKPTSIACGSFVRVSRTSLLSGGRVGVVVALKHDKYGVRFDENDPPGGFLFSAMELVALPAGATTPPLPPRPLQTTAPLVRPPRV